MTQNQSLSILGQIAPSTTGTAGQILTSNGSSNSYWTTVPNFNYNFLYSAQFNGSSSYLVASPGTASNWTFLSNQSTSYTVECWVNLSDVSTSRGPVIFSNGGGASANIGVYLSIGANNSGDILYGITSGQTGKLWSAVTAGGIISANTWYHIAVVYNNASTGSVTIYVNGVAISVTTTLPTAWAYSASAPTYDLAIGRFQYSTPGYYVLGYVSNFRITKAIVYTGAFTVPSSPLQTSQAAGTNIAAVASSQVSLLTCNALTLTDSSPNAFIITNNGGVVASTTTVPTFTAYNNATARTQTQTILTSGSGTYNTPFGVAWLRIRMVGGGGGGSGSNAGNWGGSGGGSGAYLEAAIVSPAASYAYSIGAGGGGGAAVSSGSAGANTTFGSLNCGGGLAGLYGSFNTGTAPTASGGQLNVSGIAGGGASYGTVQAIGGASGAPSPFSAGGAGSNSSGSNNPGLAGAYGSGGGGAGQTPSGSSGGSGGSGIIIIEENYPVTGQIPTNASGTTQQFTANGTGSSFTLSSSINTSDAIIAYNGLILPPTVDYTILGRTLSLNFTPANNDLIEVRTMSSSMSNIQSLGPRNKFINGAMAIDQRNAGASQTITAGAALAYTVDRWYAYCTGANVTGQRVAGSTASSQYNYQFTGAASVTGIGFGQRIETLNCYDLAGTTATLSVILSNSLLTTVTWTAYYATTADTFGTLGSPTRTQIATGTFTVTSTLTRYSTNISIPSAATTGIEVVFSVGAQTSGTWVIGTAQLEAGSTVTVFERRLYAQELLMCQRYYEEKIIYMLTKGGQYDGNGWVEVIHYITKRAIPTITLSGSSQVRVQSSTAVLTSGSVIDGSIAYISAEL